jgi:Arc/MetJ-type ribon-helix-helix transcriptional regulator
MTTKITVSLPDELVEQARAAVRAGRASSVSAYVADAMRSSGQGESLRSMVDDWLEETGGPATAEEQAWARRALGLDADE